MAESKAFLTEALFQLMEEKDFKKLTVKEVVDKAGVGRATFYRHYDTLEDVLDDYVQELQEKIWVIPEGGRSGGEHNTDSSTEPLPRDDYITDMSTDVRGATERIFRILAKEKKRLRILKKQGMAGKISGMTYRLTLATILNLGVLDNKYQPYFFAGASSAMVLAWVESGMKEPPKEMADLFIKSLHGYMEVE